MLSLINNAIMPYETKKIYRCILPLLCLTTFIGCSRVIETSKQVWGSSTKGLEKARIDAIQETFPCRLDECFDAVLALATNEPEYQPIGEKQFEVFLKDRIKCLIVMMRIPGSINTTEAGIFFEEAGPLETSVEITSFSRLAKEKTAQIVFNELNRRFVEQ